MHNKYAEQEQVYILEILGAEIREAMGRKELFMPP